MCLGFESIVKSDLSLTGFTLVGNLHLFESIVKSDLSLTDTYVAPALCGLRVL